MWWHPVAVADPGMKVADTPLPLGAAPATIRDTLTTQNAATGRGRRHVPPLHLGTAGDARVLPAPRWLGH